MQRLKITFALNTFYSGPQAWFSSHPNDAALKLLPELALRCGFSAGDYRVELCSEPHPIMVRDMIQHRRWDAMFGFVNTLRAAGMEQGIDPEKNLPFFGTPFALMA